MLLGRNHRSLTQGGHPDSRLRGSQSYPFKVENYIYFFNPRSPRILLLLGRFLRSKKYAGACVEELLVYYRWAAPLAGVGGAGAARPTSLSLGWIDPDPRGGGRKSKKTRFSAKNQLFPDSPRLRIGLERVRMR